MKTRYASFLTAVSLSLIALTYWSFTTGWDRGQASLWGHLTNHTVMVLFHSDGRSITTSESFAPPGWDHIKWNAWSIYDTNTDDNIDKQTRLQGIVRDWLNNTRFESNETRQFNIITHK